MKKILLFLSFLMLSISYSKNITDKVIAIVNNKLIFESDLKNTYKIEKLEKPFLSKNSIINNLDYKKIILDKLIFNKTINIIFNKYKISFDNDYFEKYINKVSYNLLLNKNEFLEYISKNIDLNIYKKFVKHNIFIKKIIDNEIKIEDKFLKDNFEKYINKYKNEENYKNIFSMYNINIFKIKDFKNNISKYNTLDKVLKKFKVTEDIITQHNMYILHKDKIDILEIISKNNILYLDLPDILINKIKNNNKKIIGPFNLNNNIFFIEIKKITNINKNDFFKKVDLKIINLSNDGRNKHVNYEKIYKLYCELVKNKNYINNLNKIKDKNLNVIHLNKSIDFHDNYIKKKIYSLNKDTYVSRPFEYKNNFIVLFLISTDNIKYENYLNDFIMKNYKNYSKNILFIDKIIKIIKDSIFVNIID